MREPEPASNLTTVEGHILEMQRLHPSASGDFTSLLNDVAFAAKIIAREVNRAGLADILGNTGTQNVQGALKDKHPLSICCFRHWNGFSPSKRIQLYVHCFLIRRG